MPSPVSTGSPSSLDHFVTTTSDTDVPNAFNLGSLTSGLLKHTVTSGNSVPATATAGTDYLTTLATNADAPDSTINIAVTGVGANLISKALTIAAGDQIKVELEGAIVNNSGVTRTYTLNCSLGGTGAGGLTVGLVDTAVVNASATNRLVRSIVATFGIKNSSSAWVVVRGIDYGGAALGSGSLLTASRSIGGSQQSTADLTGLKTLNISLASNVATPTQSYELTAYTIRQIATNP